MRWKDMFAPPVVYEEVQWEGERLVMEEQTRELRRNSLFRNWKGNGRCDWCCNLFSIGDDGNYGGLSIKRKLMRWKVKMRRNTGWEEFLFWLGQKVMRGADNRCGFKKNSLDQQLETLTLIFSFIFVFIVLLSPSHHLTQSNFQPRL